MSARAAIVALALLAMPAAAEVSGATPGSFTSTHTSVIAKPPAQVWAALVQWDHWWPLEHSYSQAHMTLAPMLGPAASWVFALSLLVSGEMAT